MGLLWEFFGDLGSGFRVHGLGFRVHGSGFTVHGLGFRVWDSGFGTQGLNRVHVFSKCASTSFVEAMPPNGLTH